MSAGYNDYDDGEDFESREDEADDIRRSQIRYAKDRVRMLAVVMLAFAIVSLAMVPLKVINFFTFPKMMKAQREQIERDRAMPAAQKQQVKDILDMYENIFMTVLPINMVLHSICGALSVIGSLKMLRLRSYKWAVAAAIINIASIGHGCCLLPTLVVGIWALIVLMDDRVKQGYAAARRQEHEGGDRSGGEHDQYLH